MVRAAALILVLGLSAPAMAQTTNCSRFGSSVTCRTTPDPAAGAQRAMEAAQSANQDMLRSMMAERPRPAAPSQNIDPRNVTPKACTYADRAILGVSSDLCEARAVAEKRKAVGELIAGGKCNEAVSAALAMGDVAFARDVLGFCVAVTPRPASAPAEAVTTPR